MVILTVVVTKRYKEDCVDLSFDLEPTAAFQQPQKYLHYMDQVYLMFTVVLCNWQYYHYNYKP